MNRISSLLILLLLSGIKVALMGQPASDTLEVVNIMHPMLQAYMQDSTYYHHDSFDTTVIARYYQPEQERRLDHPQGKQVSWKRHLSSQDVSQISIWVSEQPDYRRAMTFTTRSVTDTTYVIRNLLPYRHYYYKVVEVAKDSTICTLTDGRFRTTGQVRMVQVDGARNVRDIGGWPTQFGIPIRYGLLYRSGRLDNVTDEGIHQLKVNLGVRAELDLRKESRLTCSPLGDDVDFICLVTDCYAGYMARGKERLAEDLQWIVARLRENKSVNWHCAVGCDRCGTMSFLIEGLLGVSEVDLCRDYELSCFAGFKRPRSHKGFRTMLPYIKRQGPANDLAQCFYNYWLSAGVSKDDLDYLRSIMLDNLQPIE